MIGGRLRWMRRLRARRLATARRVDARARDRLDATGFGRGRLCDAIGFLTVGFSATARSGAAMTIVATPSSRTTRRTVEARKFGIGMEVRVPERITEHSVLSTTPADRADQAFSLSSS